MTTTFVQYVGDGSNRTFNVPFPYIDPTHVKVKIGGVSVDLGTHFDFLSASQLQIRPQFKPSLNTTVEIRRQTRDDAALVTYQNGSVLSADDLNTATLQALFISQEIKDYYEATIQAGFSRLNNGTAVDATAAIDAAVQSVLNSSLLASLQSRIGDIDTNAQNVIANTSSINSLQTQINTLAAVNGGQITTLIQNEQNARIAGDTALASTLALIGATGTGGSSFVLDLSKVYVDNTTSLGTRLSGIDTRFGSNEAALASEQTTRANADSSIASSVTALTATVNSNYSTLNATINNEQTARASGDSANASSITTLTARVTSAETNIATNAAAIQTEQTARASGDSANASSITTLTARVTTAEGNIASNAAAIVTEQNARASGDSANASSISTLSARVTTAEGGIASNLSAIQTEQTARANGDSANAASITTLQSRVTTAEGNISTASAQISANTTAITNANGTIASLTAQYMVKLDVNGYVSGFGTYNNGVTSDFIVLADKFSIVTPGNTPKVPFTVSGGVVYMQNVVIQDAVIANLNIGKLITGTLNANMNIGTGKIIWDNGTYMKVTGVGFGSSNQFIEWFGPHLSSYTLCTESNAISYLKTNGNAYFGGALSAGVLFNSISTSSIANNASVNLGPFGTNTHSKVVTVSYSFESTQTGSDPGSGATSATVLLERSLDNGSSWATVGTLNATGSSSWNSTDFPYVWTSNISGSLTVTDTNTSSSNFTYRARITSRTTAVGSTSVSQNITITSTES